MIQMKVESASGTGFFFNKKYIKSIENISFNPQNTVVLVMDVWDKHWCKYVNEMIPDLAIRINDFIGEMRLNGFQIIHMPGDCADYYSDYKQRIDAKNEKKVKVSRLIYYGVGHNFLKHGIFPMSYLYKGGCNCEPTCTNKPVWSRQHENIDIGINDLIATDPLEVYSILKNRNIKNIIYTGVHANICIISRPTGMRKMKKLGFNCFLVKSLTDIMYNSTHSPEISHNQAFENVIDFIEKTICPVIIDEK